MTQARPLPTRAAAAFLFCLLAGCGSGERHGSAQGSIKVGEFNTMSGSEATFGQSTHAGVVLAIEEQNARGGIHGRPIQLVSYDDRGRRTGHTRPCDATQVRRADEAMSTFRREQGP